MCSRPVLRRDNNQYNLHVEGGLLGAEWRRTGARQPGHHLYRVRFSRLGENRLTIVHDGGRETYLEFFVTGPLETLIKKRAHFIATRQQHRDPAKW